MEIQKKTVGNKVQYTRAYKLKKVLKYTSEYDYSKKSV